MSSHSEYVALPSRPAAGLVPRGLVGRTYANGRTQWSVSKSDLVQAHALHIRTARYFRTCLGSSSETLTQTLLDAAEVRQLLSCPIDRPGHQPATSTLPLLREKA